MILKLIDFREHNVVCKTKLFYLISHYDSFAEKSLKSPVILFLIILTLQSSYSQTISSSLPPQIDHNGKWLFYLHGAIVQDQGINAVSKDFGPYKYLNILDSLKSRGFNVISEARPKDTRPEDWANKVSKQIDSLIDAKLPPQNITVVGASAGAAITMEVALRLKNSKINYVIMGMCWPDTYKEYEGQELCGNFLSIYESSDPHGRCNRIFEQKKCGGSFKEIEINTGKSHGFLYQPYKEWVDPLIKWIKDKK